MVVAPQSTSKLEKDITSPVVKALNKQPGIHAWKRLSSGSSNNTGYPDITGTIMLSVGNLEFGVRLEIEMKRPGKVPTPIQYARLREFRRLGCIAFWADSNAGVIYQIKRWQKVKMGMKPNLIGYSDLKSKSVTVISDLAA